ncbi:hypothetical protein Ahy_A09g042911 [Arachis hypogaea]|uniref:Uncharacterized protein n=1 Tax=Arachis hypogaea TaxID=3818 RepID=A0A445BH53_ARAHY|nr:hypothetical protein Ahy_A09g042911 [Arachis hypogaea]
MGLGHGPLGPAINLTLLTEEIPKNIFFHLPDLWWLDLSYNWLSGKLPISLFNYCNQLKILYLFDNSFGGSIPRVIANLTQLKEIFLCDNQFQDTEKKQ